MSHVASRPIAPLPRSSEGDIHLCGDLWRYNSELLAQGVGLLDLLKLEAHEGFEYGQAVGPHLRHVIEHYQALMSTLSKGAAGSDSVSCVDYDARSRALDVQSDPGVTREKLLELMATMDAFSIDARMGLAMPLTTRLQAGTSGEIALAVPTTLGRELLFVGSHTTHHYALLTHYCQAAGVTLGSDFGKAPATVAFERRQSAAQSSFSNAAPRGRKTRLWGR